MRTGEPTQSILVWARPGATALAAAVLLAAAVKAAPAASAQVASGELTVQSVNADDDSSFTFDISSVTGGEQRVGRPFESAGGPPLELPEGEYILGPNIGRGYTYEGWAAVDGDDDCPGEPAGTDPAVPVTITAGQLTRICIYVSADDNPTVSPTPPAATPTVPASPSAVATSTATGPSATATRNDPAGTTTTTPAPPETGSGPGRASGGQVLSWLGMAALGLAIAGAAVTAVVVRRR